MKYQVHLSEATTRGVFVNVAGGEGQLVYLAMPLTVLSFSWRRSSCTAARAAAWVHSFGLIFVVTKMAEWLRPLATAV